MAKTLRYKPKFDPLKELLLDVARQRSQQDLLDLVVGRLTATRQVALCRIWLSEPTGDFLRLAVSAGRSVDRETEWSDIESSSRAGLPFGSGKPGTIAQSRQAIEIGDVGQGDLEDEAWGEAEGIRGFGGQPLLDGDELLGVLIIFTRFPLDEEWLTWLRMIADHTAVAVARLKWMEAAPSATEDVGRYDIVTGESPAAKRIEQQIDLAASVEANVFITGEPGSGKKVIASEIHRRSDREKAIVTVDCASDTDAMTRIASAQAGTVVLDEIARATSDLQEQLLDYLEDESPASRPRFIATSCLDPVVECASGRLDESLYQKLSVYPLHVPPLRERHTDIPVLTEHFLRTSRPPVGRSMPKMSEPAMKRLVSYRWPGNIRELRNVIERGIMTSPGDVMRIDLVSLASPSAHILTGADPVANDGIMTEDEMVELQKKNLLSALDRTGWKIYGPGGTAELLGLRPTTLASRIKKFGLKRSR